MPVKFVTKHGERKTMDTVTYLQQQFSNLNELLHSIAGDLTGEELLSRPAPGQNTIGYTIWHMPRTQDNLLQTWIRGQAEIAHRDRWAHWRPLRPLGIGVGITLEEADEIARTVQLDDALDYADEVHATILAWLAEINEEELDRIPDAKERLAAFPEYQTHGYLAQVDDLFDSPVWGLLMKPCMGHIHRHLGELEIVKDILRKAK
jgi:hypothetical protein